MQPITAPGTSFRTAPGRAGRPRGRWIWRLSGTATVLTLTGFIAFAAVRAGTWTDGGYQLSALPARTVIVNGTVTSLNVVSYGAPIRVSRGQVSQVTVVETITFDQKAGPPRVIARVSHGELTLAAPSCANTNCSVGFAVTVPASVTVSASSEGGPVSVAGAAAADLDSGGGQVTATAIQGLLTVTAEGGGITASGAGSASLDSGGGPVAVSGVQGPLNVTAEGGSVDAHGIGSATLDSGGGPVSASAVLGALTVSAEGGSINVTGAQGANLNAGGGPVFARTIDGPLNVTTEGGSLQVDGLTGPFTADTGNGPLTASGVSSATARVSTDGGSAWIGFIGAPQSVQVTSAGGPAVLVLPGGPYAVSAESFGGPVLVSVPVSATSARMISVSTDGGELQVKPAAAGG
jgi:hypothetical protein